MRGEDPPPKSALEPNAPNASQYSMAAAPLFQGNLIALKSMNKREGLSQLVGTTEVNPSNEAMKSFSLPKPQLGFSGDLHASTILSESSELSLNSSDK